MASRVTRSWQWTKGFYQRHKIWSICIVIALIGVIWWGYDALTPTSTQVRYVLGTVNTGTVVASVSESGQVSTSNSLSITPQVSGNITWVGVKPGQKVAAGQALMSIDDTTAVQSVDAAKKALAGQELQYQEDTAQAPVSYQSDLTALATDQQNLQDDYNTVYNDLSTTYLDLPNVMTGANDILYGYDLDSKKSQWNTDFLLGLFNSTQNTSSALSFKSSSISDYTAANTSYTASLAAYEQATRSSSNTTMDALLTQSITTMNGVSQALQDELNFLGAISDLAQTYSTHLPSGFSTLQSTTRTDLATANSDLSTLLGDEKTIDAGKQTIANDQQTVTLAEVGNNASGTNPISLQIEANNIEEAQTSLATQEANLAEYTITAPFAGTISTVPAEVGDSANGTLATIVTNTQIAVLSVNEVDAAKIALGDKVTLTFDAITGLTLTGTVAEIDTVGTVSQGVVSYTVQVSFDAQNAQVKPGMTVNANIQTAVHENTLVVPSTAIKTQGTQTYVQVFNPPLTATGGTSGVVSATPPTEIPVVVGISDNTNTEITSGVTAGQQIVVSTKTTGTTPTVAAAATTAGAGGRTFGGGGGFGGGGFGGGAGFAAP